MPVSCDQSDKIQKKVLRTLEQKTEQIERLTDDLLKKYGSTNIIVTDYWDADNTAIGLADKAKQYLVYITDNGTVDNKYSVSLENPPTSNKFPYTPSDDYKNLTTEEVERLVVYHLNIGDSNLKPNKAELQFLNLSYNRFYDIYDEVIDDKFWAKSNKARFSILKDGFSIYAELLKYEPLKYIIEEMKISRPPMEAEIGSELFKFFRNVIAHFPFFTFWDEVYVTKTLVNWEGKQSQTIDKFLEKYKGRKEVKYRIWDTRKKLFTYLSINFPSKYEGDLKVYFKDIITEKEGIIFSFSLMRV